MTFGKAYFSSHLLTLKMKLHSLVRVFHCSLLSLVQPLPSGAFVLLVFSLLLAWQLQCQEVQLFFMDTSSCISHGGVSSCLSVVTTFTSSEFAFFHSSNLNSPPAFVFSSTSSETELTPTRTSAPDCFPWPLLLTFDFLH